MEYAGFFRRFAAAFIDGIILMLPSLLFGQFSLGIPVTYGAGIIIGFLYKPFFESSVLSATPGKALLGIVVVSEKDGERITFKAAAIRFFCQYISMLIFMIGYLMQPFTKRRQALHDMLSETVVIRKESADLNYFLVWKDQFKDVVSKI
ncbi:MAG: RDD family protein [Pseudobdellovibrio sp.]